MSPTKTNEHEEVFLATTALEEFWDTTKPIVFLGEWCLRYSRRSFWEPLNGQLLESPFNNSEAAHAAYHYVNEIYERILPLLGNTLNTIHGTHHGQRYWRIVIGPWLQLYLPVIFDRYSRLKRALELYPDCTTIVMSGSAFVVPSDTLDFACFIKEDSFNLQIYTKILSWLGKSYPCKRVQTFSRANLIGNSWKRKAAGYFAKIYACVGAKASQSIFLRSAYFARPAEILILLNTVGKVFPMLPEATKEFMPPSNANTRNDLSKIEIGTSEFEHCLSAMLSADVPKCFVEGFGLANNEAQVFFPTSPKAIFSANAWYYEEAFKQWAAASAEKGTLLIGTPHGGSYGGLADMPSENHETAIVDHYYSWGWERTDCAAEVIPFPATKLAGRKKIGVSNSKTGVLWAATSWPRYLVQFPWIPEFFNEYIAWQGRFAKSLHSKIVPAVRFRPHREDGSWDIAQRLSECMPGLTIETWSVSFQESLTNCRLYVCDHCSTTFAEALAANKPTILLWNPQANSLRPEAQPYYDLLRENGILFDTPESAGEAVNQIYDDVEIWWKNPERQHAVETFCERFARNSPDAIELWVAEFKKIAAMPDNETTRLG